MKLPLWEPSAEQKQAAAITGFIALLNERYATNLSSFRELHAWSITHLNEFWALVWEFCEIKAAKPYNAVLNRDGPMMETRWFPGARLNFAENLLRRRDDHPALIFKGEGQATRRLTYAELYRQVARLAKSLRAMGIKPGDRVAGFMPNIPEAVIALLASASIGAIWSSCSPDFGTKGVLDRFGQIEPKVLFTADGYFYNGKTFDSLERVAGLTREMPSIRKVVVIPYASQEPDIRRVANAILYADFLSAEDSPQIDFELLPPDHPLYIMFTSGTTGLPKCLVQGIGGILAVHLKELKLEIDVRPQDIIFYFTTTGWMMWTWLVSNLALGATLVLYDGSPFYPDPGALWRLAEAEKVTIFGTSARYLAGLEKAGVRPGKDYDLSRLRLVLSTGSPLSVESFKFVYREIKQEIRLSSIAGGTDINGLFLTSSPQPGCGCKVLRPRGQAGDQSERATGGGDPLPLHAALLLERPG